jgi:hypothetical protein
MKTIAQLDAEVAALRKKAYTAPRDLPDSHSSAWSRFSREWSGAVDRLNSAKAKAVKP